MRHRAMSHRGSRLSCFGCSLDNNQLCGYDKYVYGTGRGTYTSEGIVVLMEGVKNSNVQSLR